MLSTREFYGGGQGDRLVDPNCYPKEIVDFLREERKLLDSMAASIDTLVEIGCMHGRYLDWAVGLNKRYIGIDIVPRYINMGRRIVAEKRLERKKYQFVLGGAEMVDVLARQKAAPGKCLLFFPFNSFGNMADPIPVILSVRKSNLPFLISSYQTKRRSTTSRREYYRRCGYKDIVCTDDEKGVCFSSADGLKSIAYHPRHVQRICDANNLAVAIRLFSTIGIAYLSKEINFIQNK